MKHKDLWICALRRLRVMEAENARTGVCLSFAQGGEGLGSVCFRDFSGFSRVVFWFYPEFRDSVTDCVATGY